MHSRSTARGPASRRILLVEDHPGDARLVRELLNETSLAAEVTWERTLSSVSRPGESPPPDLVLLDLDLPDSYGAETVERIRRTLPDTPVVALTGNGDVARALGSLRAGAMEFLEKEALTAHQLARTVRWSLERHRLERRADAERDLSRTILHSLPQHVALLDADGTIRHVNRAWKEFAAAEGGDPGGYEGESYLEVTRRAAADGSREAARMLEGLRGVLRGEGERFTLEYPCHGPQKRRWFRGEVTPIERGPRPGAVVTHMEITDRRLAEEKLRASEKKWATTIELAPVGITLTEVESGRVLAANRAAAQLVGYTTDDLLDVTVEEADTWVDRGRREAIVDRLRDQATVRNEIVELRDRSGDRHAVRVSVRRVELEGERRLLWTLQDVTETRRRLRRIERQERQQRVLAELGQRALRTDEPLDFAEGLVEVVRTTLDAAVVSLRSLDRERGQLRLRAIAGASGEPRAPESVPLDASSPAAAALRATEPVVVDAERESDPSSADPLLSRDTARGGAWARVGPQGQAWGVLAARPREGRRLRQDETSFLQSAANFLAAALRQDEAYRELEASERRYRSLFEESPDPIVITTAEGDFVRANDAFVQLFGFSHEELDTIEVEDLYEHPGERAEVLRQLESSGGVVEREDRMRTKAGNRRVVQITSSLREEPRSGRRLIRAIVRDVTQERRLERELRHRALHDYLTGLANRALFHERLDQALARADRSGEDVGLLFVDIDRFKVVNDSLGHDAGDRVLKEVASRLSASVRGRDTVARIGGDEFVLLLEDPEGRDGVERVAERVVARLADPVATGDEDVPLQVSMGVAVARPGNPTTLPGADELLDRADQAMFEAKKRPGTTLAWYTEDVAEPRPEVRRTPLHRERRLREALEVGQIRPAYQPLVALGTGEVCGYEALARWTDPELGEVSPGRFIPLAEQTGLILELGPMILRKACSDMTRYRSTGDDAAGAEPVLSVNLSAREVEDPRTQERILGILDETDFPASRLRFEVTERVAMRQSSALNRLKEELGVRLAVDDFGTEHATLAQLRELRLDALKIDRSFVRALPTSGTDRAIVEAVLTLGESLGLTVVAEGVETREQEEILGRLGCRYAQGFRFGRPGPLDEDA